MRRAAFLIVVLAALTAPASASAACRPTAAHPYPVILVHGTFANQALSWNALRPLLEADGFCVFSLDYGNNATAPMAQSGNTVAAFARKVLTQTGAAKVSFVGHSQGGSLSRYVAKDKGLLAQTDDVVGLAPSSHGTTSPFAGPAALLGCAACHDQRAGSPFMKALNAPPEAPGPVSYTVVSTRYDEVVTPYQSQALSGSTVTNVVLQSRCPGDLTEHVGIIYDPVALQWARDALLRPGPPTRPSSRTARDGRPATTRRCPPTRAARRSRPTLSCAAPRSASPTTGASGCRCAASPRRARRVAACSPCAPTAAWRPRAPSRCRRAAPRA